MQIVIDIPEEEYEAIKYYGTIVDESRDYIASRMLNGTVLPEKHGRIIDMDKLCNDLIKRWKTADKKKEIVILSVMADVVTPIIVSQPTILEAREDGET